MKREAGGQEVLPQCKGSRALWDSGRPEAVGGGHGDASPQCKSFFVVSASPETSVYPLNTHTHTELRMIQLSPHFTDGKLRSGRRTCLRSQRGLNPRPPDQPTPFLTWQLAPPSHLCSPPFSQGACPPPFNTARILTGAGTLRVSPGPPGPGHRGLASPVGERALWVQVHRLGFLKEVGPEGSGGRASLEGEEEERKVVKATVGVLTQPKCGYQNVASCSSPGNRRLTAWGRDQGPRSKKSGGRSSYQVTTGFKWE